MLYSTVELVTQATFTLNSHFVFCFCNIIIVLLFIDRAKSNSCPGGASTTDSLPVDLNTDVVGNVYEKYENVLEDDFSEGSIPEAKAETETAQAQTETAEAEAETETAEAEAEAETAEAKAEAETETANAGAETQAEVEKEANKGTAEETQDIEVTEEEETEEPEEEEEEEEVTGDDDDDDDEEELRRRIEEFINKVNEEWRKEKLRASCETD